MVISLADAKRHNLYKECLKKYGRKYGLECILYDMGLDVTKGFETMYCTHRSELTGEINTCNRFYGKERKDDAWKKVKYMVNSLERYGHTQGYYLDS